MTRGWAGAIVAIALAAGLFLRFGRLDARPMHHDEANQAVKFGALLETGQYHYDFRDHHGPTLYYLTLPAAWLRGQHSLASLDEKTLRGVTAAFGVVTILLLPLMTAGIGRTAVASSALLLALSPAMVFYSRMFIQETLFACFTLWFVIGVGRVVTGGAMTWSLVTGVAAGLAIATKETSVIVLPAAVASCAIAIVGTGHLWRRTSAVAEAMADRRSLARGRLVLRSMVLSVLVGCAAAMLVAALFYSSFLTNPAGLLQPLLGAGTYFDRGTQPASHAHPWHYYLALVTYSRSGGLTWSEGLIVALAACGALTAWTKAGGSTDHTLTRAFWPRYLACYVVLTTVIFSALPYKTPWNVLPFYVVAIVLAGVGLSRLVHVSSSHVWRGAVVLAFVFASAQLGWQAWRASVTYAADPRNPYVYAQTVPDAVRMAARIHALAALHPDKANMQVSVIARPYEQWPLPWYLRTMPIVGYWTRTDDPLALQAPVIVSSMEFAPALDAALGDRYMSEFYGLRPEVVLTLYVERGLWDRFLARQAVAQDFSPALLQQAGLKPCSTADCVAQNFSPALLWRAPSAP
jgi:uncharacterized protein (TIGR03663 family)